MKTLHVCSYVVFNNQTLHLKLRMYVREIATMYNKVELGLKCYDGHAVEQHASELISN